MSTSSGSPGSPGSGGGGGGPILPPVFVFPSQLDFYYDDLTTHKRVITIYNPYDVDVTFRVLCNNPIKYAVVEAEGKIKAQKCADTVIRHVAISPQAVQQTDKFRIQIFDQAGQEPIGKRDILATLHPGMPDPADEKQSHSLPHRSTSRTSPEAAAAGGDGSDAYSDPRGRMQPQQPHQPNIIACVAALVCILSLFLPTEGDAVGASTFFKDYPWLHLTVNQKLVFAYVLGLVTMAILRTS